MRQNNPAITLVDGGGGGGGGQSQQHIDLSGGFFLSAQRQINTIHIELLSAVELLCRVVMYTS